MLVNTHNESQNAAYVTPTSSGVFPGLNEMCQCVTTLYEYQKKYTHKTQTVKKRHVSGLPLQHSVGIPTTQLVALAGGTPAWFSQLKDGIS